MAQGVTVDFNANLTRFTTALDKATKDLSKFASNAKGQSAIMTGIFQGIGQELVRIDIPGKLFGVVSNSIDAADALNDLSDRTGIAVETLNGLQWAAQLSDTNMESLSSSVGRLNQSIGQAQAGNTAMAENLRRLGISATDPEQALYQLADAVAAMPEPARQAAELSKVLGKSYQEMLPFLKGGSDALRNMVEEGKRQNPVSAEMAKRSAEFNDNMDKLRQSGGGAATVIANSLIPALDEVAKSFLRAATSRMSFMNAASFGVNIFNPLEQQIEDLRASLESLREEQEADSKFSLFGPSNNLKRKIEEGEKQLAALEALREKEKELNKPADEKAIVSDAEAIENQTALRKALDTKPLEEFVRSLSDKRRQVSEEMAKLRADLLGPSIKDAKGGDIASEIAKGKSAVSNNDISGADASAKRATEMLKSLKDNGGISDEFTYYTRELEQLQQASLTRQSTLANNVIDNIKQAISSKEINAEKLKILIDVPFLRDQVKGALTEIYNQVESGKLVSVPLIYDPSMQNKDSISSSAMKYGARA